ncbi:putative gypsy type transposon [Panicum miliaceum]|uniref:Gypsy type transposon n=1 Tax=Panicum miliaceum TaxID=4540 RepID=A0A3L6RU11_PANMI|nr:putative gypsy type transposon [Panicum miliaceum]
MPRKSAAERGKKRENEGREESSPPAKVTKTVADGEWRSWICQEKDLLRFVAKRLLQEKGVWFYIGNHKPSLPGRDNAPPQRRDCWLDKLLKEESRDIPKLMKRIQDLKDKGVTRESMAYSFIERCIQPL